MPRFSGLLLLCALGCLASIACAARSTAPRPSKVSVAPAPSQPPLPNPWSGFAREVLFQPCGRCHRGDLPTRVPRALAVFDLLEDPWYDRLTTDQLDELLRRVRAIDGLPASDAEAVGSFVRCARDRVCEAHPTAGR